MSRFLTPDEKRLISELLARAPNTDLPVGWLDSVEVVQMDDGGMGSLRFQSFPQRVRIGKQVSELRFQDADGVDVIASLNVDEEGAPFELDIWKVNFKPLIRIPYSL